MATMQAPGSVAPGTVFTLPLSPVAYTVDAYGFVAVSTQQDINSLIREGFVVLWGGRNNSTAVLNPTSTDDVTKDYAPMSIWINQATSPATVWMCASSATSAAVWVNMSLGDNLTTSTLANLVLTGLLTSSTSSAVSAFSGGGQGSATLLSKTLNNITTASASSAPYDSVRIQPVVAGLTQVVFNNTTNPVQLFCTGSDTINGFAGSVGITIQGGGFAVCYGVVAAAALAFGSGLGAAVPRAYHTSSATVGFTSTAAQVGGASEKVYFNLTGTLGSGQSVQLPTVSNLVAGTPNAKALQTYQLRVINTSSANFAWTITTNTGWTLSSTMTIGQTAWRDFLVTFDTLSTATLQNLGGGTF